MGFLKKLKKLVRNIISEIHFKLIYLKSVFRGDYLTKLAKIYNTDKWGSHYYTPHYKTHFRKFRHKKLKLLEIGVGGFEDPFSGGNSLRMWKRYFPKGHIYSIDIYDKSIHDEKRIKTYKGSQIDKAFLMDIVKDVSYFDIIIDDGSHINEHVIETFKILFPYLNSGGIYVIEDTQTSYWPECGGDSDDLNNCDTIMNFFKKLTDGLNYNEYLKPEYQPTYFDKNILSIHFYHNLIFINKGCNSEASNLLINNQKK